MDKKHPDGSVQGICTGAIGLFALLIAFIGYTAFNQKGVNSPWSWLDLLHLVPSCLAGLFLVSVPWLATMEQDTEKVGESIRYARQSFALGAALALGGIIIFFIKDFINNHS